ncbi:hypothetical protein N7495_006364 [Penicillium taxi]|uniref:uncharacterized protein n=1 Tax=Penicillium taxi TaxID=168475 RepID=UPI0025451FC2|nr:uncharacterized protein N7495_006364 [Penicillium taxi]KAJ5894673.1 hypothetical protein N7495_006364 [Penicillium taxi]
MSIQDYSIDTSRTITHKTIELPVPWLTFITSLESRLGRYKSASVKSATTLQELETSVNEMRGDEPYTIYDIQDHGKLSTLFGRAQKARQYVLGNSLIAGAMDVHDIRVALHAPIVNLVYEKRPGFTTIEYDTAESVFRALTDGNEEVIAISKITDQTRDDLFQQVFVDASKANV